jgi:enamine deaminase RidA (YjgF/YER057c/UK114 family)
LDDRVASSTGVVPVPDGYLQIGLFSNARVAGDTIYVAGHTAIDADGKVVHPGDPEAQFRYTMNGIAHTLEQLGSSLRDLVRITVYLTDVRSREALHKIRAQYLDPPYPAATLIGVSALALEGLTVEIDGIAHRSARP